MITLQQIHDEVDKIVKAHPERLNPMGAGGSCLNTDPYDLNRHCIAAQVLVDLGYGEWLDHPFISNAANVHAVVTTNFARYMFEGRSLTYLADVQSEFDAATLANVRWGKAWETFQEGHSLAEYDTL